MANKYLDDDGLSHLWAKLKLTFATLASPTFTGTPTAPTPASTDNSTTIATTAFVKGAISGAGQGEMNQNAFSNVKVGSTTVAADSTTDTLELVGSNVTLTPDATNDKVTIGITASDVTTALGTTPVARATGDASGNAIADTYAPKSHAASGTTYGKGTSSNYGHVKLSDATDGTSAAASGGTAATPKAVSDALAAAKSYADSTVVGMYSYKGSVASASNLPASPSTGDVYNIESASTYGAAGANVAWNGSAWDSLGEIFSITAITNAEIDTIVAS